MFASSLCNDKDMLLTHIRRRHMSRPVTWRDRWVEGHLREDIRHSVSVRLGNGGQARYIAKGRLDI
jgi:hypothetical protein